MTVKWRHCPIAERDHREDVRNYAHTYHYPHTICFAKAFWKLPREYRNGILLHEIGHLIAGPEGSESDANEAVFNWAGTRIEYVDSPYGKRLERVKNMAGVRIIGRRRVTLNPDDVEDIDWKQRYGQEEQPEIAEYLGYESEPDIEFEEEQNPAWMGYDPRFVPRDLWNELVNLWHLSRVPFSGVREGARYKRMIWTSEEFHKAHPEISSTAAYKDLSAFLEY